MSFHGEGTAILVGTAEQTIVMGNITSRNVVIGNLTYPGFNIGNRSLLVNGGLEVNGNLLVNGTKIAIGTNAGLTSQSTSAVAIGTSAGNTNQGSNSVAVGTNAGTTSQGADTVAIGNTAGTSSQSSYCVAVGYGAGRYNQGNLSVAIGALASETSQGSNSVAVGYGAGQLRQLANSVAIGINAGATSQGSNSVAVGTSAGISNLALNSIVIGRESVSTGSNSIAIGYGATASTFTNSVAIGTSATCSTSNQIQLGTASVNVSISGKLGVATTLNQQALQVNGNIILGNTTNGWDQAGSRYIGIGSAGSVGVAGFSGIELQSVNAPAPNDGNYSQNIRFWCHLFGVGPANPRMMIRYDGNVGIGTNTPTQMLGIENSMRVNQANASNNKLLVLWDGGVTDAVATATAFFGFGINANTLRYQVNVNGENHTFFGGTTQYGRINNNTSGFQIGSDRKLKKNITELDYGLNEILQLKPSRYLMKEENEGDPTHIGLIAQDVQPILPEVVHECLEDDNTTTLMLSHIGFIPVLIRAIQQQQQHIQNLEERLRTLENSR